MKIKDGDIVRLLPLDELYEAYEERCGSNDYLYYYEDTNLDGKDGCKFYIGLDIIVSRKDSGGFYALDTEAYFEDWEVIRKIPLLNLEDVFHG